MQLPLRINFHIGDGITPNFAMLFGVAAALTLDEFALWLNLRDVYWEREGRESFEALALFGSLLAVGAFGWRFWHGVTTELASILWHGAKTARSSS